MASIQLFLTAGPFSVLLGVDYLEVFSIVDQPQEIPNGAMGFDWVAQRLLGENLILVLSPYFLSADKAGNLEVLNDSLDGSLGNADLSCHLTKDQLGLGSEQNQHMGMVGEKGPAMRLFRGLL